MKLIKNRIYIKFLTSYVVILAIPLLLSFFFVNNHTRVIMKNYVEKELEGKIQQVSNRFDEEITDIIAVATVISENSLLHNPQIMDLSIVDKLNLVRTISNTINSNNILLDGLVYIRKNRTCFSLSGMHQLDEIRDRLFIMDERKGDDYIKLLNNIKEPTFQEEREIQYDIRNTQTTMLFSAPFPSSPSEPLMTVSLFIGKKPFEDIYDNLFAHNKSSLYIFNDRNEIFCTLGINVIDSDYVFNLYSERGSLSKTIELKGEEYYFSAVNSSTTNWTYIILNPQRIIMAEIISLRRRYLFWLTAILLISSLLIQLFTRLNYSPIKDLIVFSQSILEKDTENRGFAHVKDAMALLVDRKNELNNEIHYLERDIKSILIRELLTGTFGSKDIFNESVKKHNIQLPFDNIILLCIKSPKEGISDFIENTFKDCPIKIYSGKPFSNNLIYSIVSCTCSRNLDFIKKYDDQLQKIVQYFQSSIIISNSIISINRLPHGMSKIIEEIEFNPQDKNEIIPIKLPDERTESLLRDENAQKIITAVIGGKTKLIMDLFQKTIECEEKSKVSTNDLKHDIFYFISSMAEFSHEENNSSISKICKIKIEKVLSLDSKERCINLLKELAYEMIELSHEEKPESENTMAVQITNHVEANLYNPNFGLQNIAETLNISTPYISRLFKTHNAIGLSEYIKVKRIEKAKDYLLNTQFEIKEISLMIGYNDVSHFIRVFKSVEQETPKAFRSKKI